jgi:hypothetical protein
MATTTNTLQPVSVVAERALYGQPDFTVLHPATATALSAVAAGVSQKCLRMFKLVLSYSAAPAVSVLTVQDGTTVIFQAEISASAPFVYQFDFSAKPLRGSAGAALSAQVGSAGGSVVQTICWTGDTIPAS